MITGGSSEIGLATAKAMVSNGARVIIVSRRPAGPRIGEARHVSANLIDRDASGRVVSVARREFGHIDVLINNNFGTASMTRFEDVADEQWWFAFRTNVLSAIHMTRAALPGMLARGTGTIVNVASSVGLQLNQKMPEYSISEAALLAATRDVASAYGSRGIRCNAVISGPTRTSELTDAGGFAEPQGGGLPLGRFAEPQEIADVIVFLCSRPAAHVNGVEWTVNGGSTA